MKTSQKSPGHLSLGQLGEAYAAAYLEQLGFRLVAANFTLPVGRDLQGKVVTAEIDLIAYDGETLCFVEVKSRASDWFAPPQVNVDRRKRRQVARAARAYRHMMGIEDDPYRYDVVTVVLGQGENGKETLEIELLRNFWREEQLRKRRYSQHYYD
jgi:putative endonuclease